MTNKPPQEEHFKAWFKKVAAHIEEGPFKDMLTIWSRSAHKVGWYAGEENFMQNHDWYE